MDLGHGAVVLSVVYTKNECYAAMLCWNNFPFYVWVWKAVVVWVSADMRYYICPC